jgi:alpha-L-arabinofuranosidase
MKTARRQFLKTAAGAGTVWLAGYTGRHPVLSAQAANSRIEILLYEPIGTIAPEIYGHFVEHLGGVVYDGIWVGENSKIPNVGGIRQQLLDHLKKIRPAVIRWPGGCFADQYDWRDGIGVREKRPRRTNFWITAPEWPKNSKAGPHLYDTNHFGTVEFTRFCRLSGAQPYFAANLRSLRPHDFWQWVEYCNSPAGTTTLAELREADGERNPLNVRFWGVGNESWGCGGNFTPEEYAMEFRRFVEWVPTYGNPLSYIGSGPNGGDLEWTRRFFLKLAERNALGRMWGWALHHYSWNASGGRTNNWLEGKGDALHFDNEQYYEILREAERMESLITAHWSLMNEIDRQNRVKLAVDEWGAWYRPGTEPFPEALFGQQNTLRDAVLAGITLELFLAHEDKFCVTPTYHVFDMYAAHQDAQSVRTVFSAPPVSYLRNGKPTTLYGLNGSASVSGKQLTVTVTNPSLSEAREAEIALRGGAPKSAKAVTLAGADVRQCNTFESPRAVQPKEEVPTSRGPLLVHRFPPGSVTKLEVTLV